MKFDFHNNMGPEGHGKIGKGGSINGNGLIGEDEERYWIDMDSTGILYCGGGGGRWGGGYVLFLFRVTIIMSARHI